MSSTQHDDVTQAMYTYKKRTGTSGISGQLYETRLVSLILFRLLHDEDVEEFYLASNMDDIGAYDDICFRTKIKGLDRPILIFIQAKHKEDDLTFLNYDLIKNFHDSFVKVRDNFYGSKTTSQDVFFKGKFDEVDCLFVLYTNAKFYNDTDEDETDIAGPSSKAHKQIKKQYISSFSEKVSSLIGTGEGTQGSQAEYTENDLEFANDKIVEEEITILAEHFAKFLNDQSVNMLLDKYVVLYHPILAREVVNVSDIQSEIIVSEKKGKVKKGGQKTAQDSKDNVKQEHSGNMKKKGTTELSSDDRHKTKKNIDKESKGKNSVESKNKPENIKPNQVSENKSEKVHPESTKREQDPKGKNPESTKPEQKLKQKKQEPIKQGQELKEHTPESTDPRQELKENNADSTKPGQKLKEKKPESIKPGQELKEHTPESTEPRQELKKNNPDSTKPGHKLKEKKPESIKQGQELKENNLDSTKPGQELKEKKSEQPTGEVRRFREITFKPEFLNTNDKNLTIMRNKIYDIVIINELKNKKKLKTADIDQVAVEKQITEYLSEPSAANLSPLIGTCITVANTKLKFTINRPNGDVQKLDEINSTINDLPSIVKEAEMIAAKNILSKKKLKVSASFGNLDIAIAGDCNKIARRIKILADLFGKLCKESKTVDKYNIVTIEKSIGDGYLNLTGGISSAVGNLLVYDKGTNLLKFTDDDKPLKENAKALYDELKLNVTIAENFDSYRFDVKSLINFPQLKLDYTEDAKNILNKIVVYEKQSNHNGVEKILREEIDKVEASNEPESFAIQSDQMVINYHDEVQKWWLATKTGTFFTKSSDIYKRAIKIISDPQITALQTTFYINNTNNLKYKLSANALATIAQVASHKRTIIVTDVFVLTIVKTLNCLIHKGYNKYTVLVLEYILNLPAKEFEALNTELKNTKKRLIFVCDKSKDMLISVLHERLDILATSTTDKEIIAIVNKDFYEISLEYFKPDVVLNDEGRSLMDFELESIIHIINNRKVDFQGTKVVLGSLVDKKSVAFVKGAVLDKILRDETIKLGQPLTNPQYEAMEHLYIDRKVHLASNVNQMYDFVADRSELEAAMPKGRPVRRFEDIGEEAVLITADPGMGKSTLLTHLSLASKQSNTGLWIVRINLLDHSKAFYDWQTQDIDINILETLKIMCQVLLKKSDVQVVLKEMFWRAYLDGTTGDEWADFELNMFLHFFNERKVLFLFDGFDEICPHYKDDVIKFLNVVMHYPNNHRVWVTCRPYSEILPDLINLFGKSYELEYVNNTQQKIYLNAYWHENLIVEDLNEIQLRKATSYIDFMRTKDSPSISRIFFLFYEHLHWYFPHIDLYTSHANSIPIVLNPHLTDFNGKLVERPVGILMETPLLLYLYAKYFVNLIRVRDEEDNWKFHLENSTLSVYEMFIDTKLRILFEDKNGMNVYTPDIRIKYEREYNDCVNMHKKLAAYTLFFHRIHIDELKHLHPFKDSTEYEAAINEIQCGTEKVGLISHITADNIPVFIYKTLEEYFANEYLCEILKDPNIDFSCKNMMYSVAKVTISIFSWMYKKSVGDAELRENLLQIERKRGVVTDIYGFLFATGWPIEHLIRIRSSSEDDYEEGCFAEYNEADYKRIRRLNKEDKRIETIEFQKNVIAKMKPHLKQHFIDFLGDSSQK